MGIEWIKKSIFSFNREEYFAIINPWHTIGVQILILTSSLYAAR